MKCSYNYISVVLKNEIPRHALQLSRRKVQAAYSARGRTRWVESVREAHTVGDRYGLPSGLSPSQVRLVLELVNGPATSAELGRRIGLSRRTTGDHLRALQVLGLVVIIDRFAFDRHDHKNLHRRMPSDYLLTGRCMDLLSQPAGASP